MRGKFLMSNKIKKILKYLSYILASNIIFGCIIYFTYTWLVGFSLLYAYLGNLALIILGLILDELAFKTYQSEKFVTAVKKEHRKEIEKNYRIIQWQMDNFVSFKATLYMFYVLILIFSQIIEFYPTLVGENLENFILANSYSILLLIAFDQIIGQFSKDRRKAKDILVKLKKDLFENQD